MKLLAIFRFRVNSEMWQITMSGRSLGFMGLMQTMRGCLCGMSSPGSNIGEMYHGVWEGISMSFSFPQNTQGLLDTLLCLISQILFRSMTQLTFLWKGVLSPSPTIGTLYPCLGWTDSFSPLSGRVTTLVLVKGGYASSYLIISQLC